MDFCSLFFKQEMELSLIGLQNAGKTSLVNVIAVMLMDFIFVASSMKLIMITYFGHCNCRLVATART